MSYVQRTMIVPAQQALKAQSVCKGLAGSAGTGMFLVGLSPTGSGEATHFISSGMIEEDFAVLLPLTRETERYPGVPEVIVGLAEQVGMTLTLPEVQALLDSCDVTEGDPHSRLDTLGLKIVQAEEL